MAGGKETPRQKMVGLMYLVLMALLAMNVSKDVLNAFIIVNDSLETTNANFTAKNETTYNLFAKANLNDPVKTGPYYKQALEIQEKSNELFEYIEKLKGKVIAATDGMPEEYGDTISSLWHVQSKDNYDAPTAFLIGDEVTNPKTGEWTAVELRDKIAGYRDYLNGVLGKDTAAVKIGMETNKTYMENGVKTDWIAINFYHSPLVACIAQLTKMQSDIKNAEADVIKNLYKNIDAGDFKFDTLAVKVIPNTNYVFVGDTYKAQVIIAAYSTTQNPVLEVGDIDTSSGIPTVPNPQDTDKITVNKGLATYAIVPRSEGVVEWGGVLKVKKPDGTYKPYVFKESYRVAKKSLVVSPTAMNVFYKGIENPMEVSAPGIPTENLKVSVTNAQMSGSKGKYVIIPNQSGSESIVSVSAEVNGRTVKIGESQFRLKPVPPPQPFIGDITGSGVMPQSMLAAQAGVRAVLENFVFDLKFNVVSFKVSTIIKGELKEVENRGPAFSSDVKTLLNATRKGSKVFFEDIKAKGPDGTVKPLGSVIIKVS